MSSPRSSAAPSPAAAESAQVLLRSREVDVLRVLLDRAGRVVARSTLASLAGLDGLNSRRVDAIMVELRRSLPVGAIVTVRRRGWMIDPAHHDTARQLVERSERGDSDS